MPRRDDLRKIMLLGSGPIVIGQACEFDYSGAQGAKALRQEGYEVVLVNSNPATIMTDPELADRTYIEPLEPRTVARILERERPQALLPTLGGQTALNLGLALHDDGTLDRLGVELIGASPKAIRKAEDRKLFKEAMERIGVPCPRSGYAYSIADGERQGRLDLRRAAGREAEGFESGKAHWRNQAFRLAIACATSPFAAPWPTAIAAE